MRLFFFFGGALVVEGDGFFEEVIHVGEGEVYRGCTVLIIEWKLMVSRQVIGCL